MKAKRLLSILLVAALLLASIGCVEKDSSGNPISPSSPQSWEAQEQASFDAYLLQSFQEVAGDNLFDCRFMLRHPESFGLTQVPLNMGRLDFDELDNAQREWQEDYDELAEFKYEALTPEQQFTHDLILHDLELAKPAVGLEYYNEYNSPMLGIQSQLPGLLGEFKLYTVQDAYDYLTMLESVPLYLQDLLKYQQIRSERGLFMNDNQLEGTLQSCKNFTTKREDNALITGFEERIAALPEITQKDIDQLKALNQKAVLETMIPAYEDFMAGLLALKGTGKNEGGLCGLPEGKRYYEYLAQSSTGSDRTVTQMTKLIDDALEEQWRAIGRISSKDPKVFDRWETAQVDITDPMKILDALRQRSATDFPPLRQLNYEVKYVDSTMEESSSPAFFIIPQVDNTGNTSIYINGKYKDDINYLFTTMGHEGYPGHMYQNSYFQELNPNPIRRLLHYGGYIEGWASYVEQLAFEMMELEDPQVTALMQADNMINLLLSCRVDIGVNYEGWDFEATKEYLSAFGLGADQVVKSIRDGVIEDPANYLKYGVGLLEFQQLRRYAELELGEQFTPQEFHKAVLDVGPAPFALVRQAVERYVEGVQAAAQAPTSAATAPQEAKKAA